MKPSWIALLLLLGAAPLAAQNTVTGVRPLAFGVVMRGTTNTVLPSDPIRSGRFYIRYRLNDQVRLNFTLPNSLARVGGGATMSINFTNQSAIAQGTAGNSVPVTFNAHSPITFTLTTSPDFYVNLGGRVSPSTNQATGTYVGTVTLTVMFL